MQRLETEAVIRKHGRTFYVASRLLSRESRDAAIALYALCRTIDDIADGTLPDVDKTEQLRAEADAAQRHALFAHPALAPMAAELASPMAALINGAARDATEWQRGWVIESTQDLIDYCYAVAGTVGEMMCPILGVTDARAIASAVSLGIAMQLTNIARDVEEDARMGRRYVPAAWNHPTAQDDRVHVQLILQLADEYYRRAAFGFAAIPLRNRLAIVAAATMYREIGVNIAKNGYAVQKRVVVPRAQKLRCLVRAASRWALGAIAPSALLEF
jgi:15-cis-phytoene synthase